MPFCYLTQLLTLVISPLYFSPFCNNFIDWVLYIVVRVDYFSYIDIPDLTVPDSNEEKVAKRKWLIDICSKYVEKYILINDDVTTLVTQTCELNNRVQARFSCRHPDCDKTYTYHSERVK